MALRRKLLITVPIALLCCVNVARITRWSTLTKRFVKARETSALEEAKEFLDVCITAAADADGEVDPSSGGSAILDASGQQPCVTVCMNSIPSSVEGSCATLSFRANSLEQRSWPLSRIYDLLCALVEILRADGHRAKSAKSDPDSGSEKPDVELVCVDLWNVLCAIAGAKLASAVATESLLDGDDDLAQAAGMCSAALQHYHPNTWIRCRKRSGNASRAVAAAAAPGAPESLPGSAVCRFDEGRLWVHRMDRKVLWIRAAAVDESTSDLRNAAIFARTIFRFCTWKQVAVVVLVSVCGQSLLNRARDVFHWDSDVTLNDLASRQAGESGTTSFHTFVKSVCLGHPGKLLAVSCLLETVFDLLSSSRDSFISSVAEGYRASITRDTFMALSRLDYKPQAIEETWRRISRALATASSPDYFNVDFLISKCFWSLRTIATIVVYPVEFACGWATSQYMTYTELQLSHLQQYEDFMAELQRHGAAAVSVSPIADASETFSLAEEDRQQLQTPIEATAVPEELLPLMTTASANEAKSAEKPYLVCAAQPKGRGRPSSNSPPHYGLSLLLLVVTEAFSDGGKDKGDASSSVVACRSAHRRELWTSLLLQTRLPLSPLFNPHVLLSAVTLRLCEAALSADGPFCAALPATARRFFRSRVELLKVIVRDVRKVMSDSQRNAFGAGPAATGGISTRPAGGDSGEGPSCREADVFNTIVDTHFEDLRLGGWVGYPANLASSWMAGTPSDDNESSGAVLRDFTAPPPLGAASFRAVQSIRAAALEVVLKVVEISHVLVPPLVMVAAATFYPSRLHRLSTSEAAAAPDELFRLSEEYPLFPETANSWPHSGCTCGGHVIRNSSPAMGLIPSDPWSKDHSYGAAVKAIERICAARPDVDFRSWEQCEPLPVSGGWTIEFRDVSFRYPNSLRYAVRNVSFTVDAGGFLGIIGYSGAGKSTLLLLLARIYAPTSGSILLNGKPIEVFPVRELRRRIGNVWQESGSMRFLPQLSIEGNVAMGNLLGADEDSIAAALKAAEAWAFVESRGRGRRGNMNVTEMSGGEVERLSIARGLMKKSNETTGLFLFDECTSAMDSLTEHTIMSRVDEAAITGHGAAPTEAVTKIMVSHRLSSLRSADEIIVLVEGMVAERGTWDQLLANPTASIHFHRLLASQVLEQTPPPASPPIHDEPATH